jgi:hypothetical protein
MAKGDVLFETMWNSGLSSANTVTEEEGLRSREDKPFRDLSDAVEKWGLVAAEVKDYKTWLRAYVKERSVEDSSLFYLNAELNPDAQHLYLATRDFEIHASYGFSRLNIIVPSGIQWQRRTFGPLGDNRVYSIDDQEMHGGSEVIVFNNTLLNNPMREIHQRKAIDRFKHSP